MSTARPTIALVAGEASGDQLGGELLKHLRKRYPQARFVGIGGHRMRDQGMETWWDSEELAVFGLFEVLGHFSRLYAIRKSLRRRLLDLKPDVFIGIDAPDFNLGLEISLRKRNISTIHYVSPTVWAWRPGRVRKIARAADHVLCLFPFEPDFYRHAGVSARYVGHPMADRIASRPDARAARRALNLGMESEVVALLPGSRAGEVSRLAQPMLEAARLLTEQRPGARLVAALANERVEGLFRSFLANGQYPEIERVRGRTLEVLAAADVVLVASGTAALETLLVNRPMVVCYRLSAATYGLVKTTGLIKTPYVSLPNILAGEALVPELLQGDATGRNLAVEAAKWLDEPSRRHQLMRRFDELHQELRCDAGQRAADAVAELIGMES